MSDTETQNDADEPQDTDADEPKEESPDEPKPGASLPERATFALAIGVSLLLTGFLGWHGWEQRKGTPRAQPKVEAVVRAQQAVPQPQGWAVPVLAINRGPIPLREVQIKIEVTDTDGKPGERELLFGFLAEGATETGYVTTFANPAAAPPHATVQSFQTKADARGY